MLCRRWPTAVYRLATVQDDGQFLYELQDIKKKADYLMSIETFSLFNLF